MKRRWVIAGLVLAGLLTKTPQYGTDVARLLPIEVIQMEKRGNRIYLYTDTEAQGVGATIQEAVENMKQTAPGTVFLETADYLLVDRESLPYLPESAEYIRPGSKLCIAEESLDLQKTAQFLAVHTPSTTLADYRGGITHISVITCRKETLILEP